MARKDDLLQDFLSHELFETKYGLNREELPRTVREALLSNQPIVKAIAIIVEGLDGTSLVTDSVLRIQVTQFLNEHYGN